MSLINPIQESQKRGQIPRDIDVFENVVLKGLDPNLLAASISKNDNIIIRSPEYYMDKMGLTEENIGDFPQQYEFAGELASNWNKNKELFPADIRKNIKLPTEGEDLIGNVIDKSVREIVSTQHLLTNRYGDLESPYSLEQNLTANNFYVDNRDGQDVIVNTPVVGATRRKNNFKMDVDVDGSITGEPGKGFWRKIDWGEETYGDITPSMWGDPDKFGINFADGLFSFISGATAETGKAAFSLAKAVYDTREYFTKGLENPNTLVDKFFNTAINKLNAYSYKPSEEASEQGPLDSWGSFWLGLANTMGQLAPQLAFTGGVATIAKAGLKRGLGKSAKKFATKNIDEAVEATAKRKAIAQSTLPTVRMQNQVQGAAIGFGTMQATGHVYDGAREAGLSPRDAGLITLTALPAVALTERIASPYIARSFLRENGTDLVASANKVLSALKSQNKVPTSDVGRMKAAKEIFKDFYNKPNIKNKWSKFTDDLKQGKFGIDNIRGAGGFMREATQETTEEMWYILQELVHDAVVGIGGDPNAAKFGTRLDGDLFKDRLAGSFILGGFAGGITDAVMGGHKKNTLLENLTKNIVQENGDQALKDTEDIMATAYLNNSIEGSRTHTPDGTLITSDKGETIAPVITIPSEENIKGFENKPKNENGEIELRSEADINYYNLVKQARFVAEVAKESGIENSQMIHDLVGPRAKEIGVQQFVEGAAKALEIRNKKAEIESINTSEGTEEEQLKKAEDVKRHEAELEQLNQDYQTLVQPEPGSLYSKRINDWVKSTQAGLVYANEETQKYFNENPNATEDYNEIYSEKQREWQEVNSKDTALSNIDVFKNYVRFAKQRQAERKAANQAVSPVLDKLIKTLDPETNTNLAEDLKNPANISAINDVLNDMASQDLPDQDIDIGGEQVNVIQALQNSLNNVQKAIGQELKGVEGLQKAYNIDKEVRDRRDNNEEVDISIYKPIKGVTDDIEKLKTGEKKKDDTDAYLEDEYEKFSPAIKEDVDRLTDEDERNERIRNYLRADEMQKFLIENDQALAPIRGAEELGMSLDNFKQRMKDESQPLPTLPENIETILEKEGLPGLSRVVRQGNDGDFIYNAFTAEDEFLLKGFDEITKDQNRAASIEGIEEAVKNLRYKVRAYRDNAKFANVVLENYLNKNPDPKIRGHLTDNDVPLPDRIYNGEEGVRPPLGDKLNELLDLANEINSRVAAAKKAKNSVTTANTMLHHAAQKRLFTYMFSRMNLVEGDKAKVDAMLAELSDLEVSEVKDLVDSQANDKRIVKSRKALFDIQKFIYENREKLDRATLGEILRPFVELGGSQYQIHNDYEMVMDTSNGILAKSLNNDIASASMGAYNHVYLVNLMMESMIDPKARESVRKAIYEANPDMHVENTEQFHMINQVVSFVHTRGDSFIDKVLQVEKDLAIDFKIKNNEKNKNESEEAFRERMAELVEANFDTYDPMSISVRGEADAGKTTMTPLALRIVQGLENNSPKKVAVVAPTKNLHKRFSNLFQPLIGEEGVGLDVQILRPEDFLKGKKTGTNKFDIIVWDEAGFLTRDELNKVNQNTPNTVKIWIGDTMQIKSSKDTDTSTAIAYVGAKTTPATIQYSSDNHATKTLIQTAKASIFSSLINRKPVGIREFPYAYRKRIKVNQADPDNTQNLVYDGLEYYEGVDDVINAFVNKPRTPGADNRVLVFVNNEQLEQALKDHNELLDKDLIKQIYIMDPDLLNETKPVKIETSDGVVHKVQPEIFSGSRSAETFLAFDKEIIQKLKTEPKNDPSRISRILYTAYSRQGGYLGTIGPVSKNTNSDRKGSWTKPENRTRASVSHEKNHEQQRRYFELIDPTAKPESKPAEEKKEEKNVDPDTTQEKVLDKGKLYIVTKGKNKGKYVYKYRGVGAVDRNRNNQAVEADKYGNVKNQHITLNINEGSFNPIEKEVDPNKKKARSAVVEDTEGNETVLVKGKEAKIDDQFVSVVESERNTDGTVTAIFEDIEGNRYVVDDFESIESEVDPKPADDGQYFDKDSKIAQMYRAGKKVLYGSFDFAKTNNPIEQEDENTRQLLALKRPLLSILFDKKIKLNLEYNNGELLVKIADARQEEKLRDAIREYGEKRTNLSDDLRNAIDKAGRQTQGQYDEDYNFGEALLYVAKMNTYEKSPNAKKNLKQFEKNTDAIKNLKVLEKIGKDNQDDNGIYLFKDKLNPNQPAQVHMSFLLPGILQALPDEATPVDVEDWIADLESMGFQIGPEEQKYIGGKNEETGIARVALVRSYKLGSATGDFIIRSLPIEEAETSELKARIKSDLKKVKDAKDLDELRLAQMRSYLLQTMKYNRSIIKNNQRTYDFFQAISGQGLRVGNGFDFGFGRVPTDEGVDIETEKMVFGFMSDAILQGLDNPSSISPFMELFQPIYKNKDAKQFTFNKDVSSKAKKTVKYAGVNQPASFFDIASVNTSKTLDAPKTKSEGRNKGRRNTGSHFATWETPVKHDYEYSKTLSQGARIIQNALGNFNITSGNTPAISTDAGESIIHGMVFSGGDQSSTRVFLREVDGMVEKRSPKHEVFHVVWRHALTPEARRIITLEYNSINNTNLNEAEVEEEMAQWYAEVYEGTEIKGKDPWYTPQGILQRFREFLNRFFHKWRYTRPTISKLIGDIESGYFRGVKMNWNPQLDEAIYQNEAFNLEDVVPADQIEKLQAAQRKIQAMGVDNQLLLDEFENYANISRVISNMKNAVLDLTVFSKDSFFFYDEEDIYDIPTAVEEVYFHIQKNDEENMGKQWLVPGLKGSQSLDNITMSQALISKDPELIQAVKQHKLANKRVFDAVANKAFLDLDKKFTDNMYTDRDRTDPTAYMAKVMKEVISTIPLRQGVVDEFRLEPFREKDDDGNVIPRQYLNETAIGAYIANAGVRSQQLLKKNATTDGYTVRDAIKEALRIEANLITDNNQKRNSVLSFIHYMTEDLDGDGNSMFEIDEFFRKNGYPENNPHYKQVSELVQSFITGMNNYGSTRQVDMLVKNTPDGDVMIPVYRTLDPYTENKQDIKKAFDNIIGGDGTINKWQIKKVTDTNIQSFDIRDDGIYLTFDGADIKIFNKDRGTDGKAIYSFTKDENNDKVFTNAALNKLKRILNLGSVRNSVFDSIINPSQSDTFFDYIRERTKIKSDKKTFYNEYLPGFVHNMLSTIKLNGQVEARYKELKDHHDTKVKKLDSYPDKELKNVHNELRQKAYNEILDTQEAKDVMAYLAETGQETTMDHIFNSNEIEDMVRHFHQKDKFPMPSDFYQFAEILGVSQAYHTRESGIRKIKAFDGTVRYVDKIQNEVNRKFSDGSGWFESYWNKKYADRLDESPFVKPGVSAPVKSGVNDIFNQSPELSKIGTPGQYSAYLDTVFPDSKVKDVLYHGSAKKIQDAFKDNITEEGFSHGIFFTDSKEYLQELSKVKDTSKVTSVLINAKDNQEIDQPLGYGTGQYWYFEQYDSIKGRDAGQTVDGTVYAVARKEQIHILGSKKDISGFKRFVEKIPKTVYYNRLLDPNDQFRINNITTFQSARGIKATSNIISSDLVGFLSSMFIDGIKKGNKSFRVPLANMGSTRTILIADMDFGADNDIFKSVPMIKDGTLTNMEFNEDNITKLSMDIFHKANRMYELSRDNVLNALREVEGAEEYFGKVKKSKNPETFQKDVLKRIKQLKSENNSLYRKVIDNVRKRLVLSYDYTLDKEGNFNLGNASLFNDPVFNYSNYAELTKTGSNQTAIRKDIFFPQIRSMIDTIIQNRAKLPSEMIKMLDGFTNEIYYRERSVEEEINGELQEFKETKFNPVLEAMFYTYLFANSAIDDLVGGPRQYFKSNIDFDKRRAPLNTPMNRFAPGEGMMREKLHLIIKQEQTGDSPSTISERDKDGKLIRSDKKTRYRLRDGLGIGNMLVGEMMLRSIGGKFSIVDPSITKPLTNDIDELTGRPMQIKQAIDYITEEAFQNNIDYQSALKDMLAASDRMIKARNDAYEGNQYDEFMELYNDLGSWTDAIDQFLDKIERSEFKEDYLNSMVWQVADQSTIKYGLTGLNNYEYGDNANSDLTPVSVNTSSVGYILNAYQDPLDYEKNVKLPNQTLSFLPLNLRDGVIEKFHTLLYAMNEEGKAEIDRELAGIHIPMDEYESMTRDQRRIYQAEKWLRQRTAKSVDVADMGSSAMELILNEAIALDTSPAIGVKALHSQRNHYNRNAITHEVDGVRIILSDAEGFLIFEDNNGNKYSLRDMSRIVYEDGMPKDKRKIIPSLQRSDLKPVDQKADDIARDGKRYKFIHNGISYNVYSRPNGSNTESNASVYGSFPHLNKFGFKKGESLNDYFTIRFTQPYKKRGDKHGVLRINLRQMVKTQKPADVKKYIDTLLKSKFVDYDNTPFLRESDAQGVPYEKLLTALNELTTNVFANRVPSTRPGSGGLADFVDIISDNANVMYFSAEQTKLTDADNDIDQLTTYYKHYDEDFNIVKSGKDGLANELNEEIVQWYKDPENFDNIYITSSNEELDAMEEESSVNWMQGSLGYFFDRYDANQVAEEAIGKFALSMSAIGDLMSVGPDLAKFAKGFSYLLQENNKRGKDHPIVRAGDFVQLAVDHGNSNALSALNIRAMSATAALQHRLLGNSPQQTKEFFNDKVIKKFFKDVEAGMSVTGSMTDLNPLKTISEKIYQSNDAFKKVKRLLKDAGYTSEGQMAGRLVELERSTTTADEVELKRLIKSYDRIKDRISKYNQLKPLLINAEALRRFGQVVSLRNGILVQEAEHERRNSNLLMNLGYTYEEWVDHTQNITPVKSVVRQVAHWKKYNQNYINAEPELKEAMLENEIAVRNALNLPAIVDRLPHYREYLNSQLRNDEFFDGIYSNYSQWVKNVIKDHLTQNNMNWFVSDRQYYDMLKEVEDIGIDTYLKGESNYELFTSVEQDDGKYVKDRHNLTRIDLSNAIGRRSFQKFFPEYFTWIQDVSRSGPDVGMEMLRAAGHGEKSAREIYDAITNNRLIDTLEVRGEYGRQYVQFGDSSGFRTNLIAEYKTDFSRLPEQLQKSLFYNHIISTRLWGAKGSISDVIDSKFYEGLSRAKDKVKDFVFRYAPLVDIDQEVYRQRFFDNLQTNINLLRYMNKEERQNVTLRGFEGEDVGDQSIYVYEKRGGNKKSSVKQAQKLIEIEQKGGDRPVHAWVNNNRTYKGIFDPTIMIQGSPLRVMHDLTVEEMDELLGIIGNEKAGFTKTYQDDHDFKDGEWYLTDAGVLMKAFVKPDGLTVEWRVAEKTKEEAIAIHMARHYAEVRQKINDILNTNNATDDEISKAVKEGRLESIEVEWAGPDVGKVKAYITKPVTSEDVDIEPVDIGFGIKGDPESKPTNSILTNQARRSFIYKGEGSNGEPHLYMNVHHAYETLKSGNFDSKFYGEYVENMKKKDADPYMRSNRRIKSRAKASKLMRDVLFASFNSDSPTGKKAREALLDTKEAAFTYTGYKKAEGNDLEWGSVLPKMIQEVRDKLVSDKVVASARNLDLYDQVRMQKIEKGGFEVFTKFIKKNTGINILEGNPTVLPDGTRDLMWIERDGNIYYDPYNVYMGLPIHEFQHIFNYILKIKAPEKYRQLLDKVAEHRGDTLYKAIQQLYPDKTQEQLDDEYLATVAGFHNVDLIEEWFAKHSIADMNAAQRIWEGTKDFFRQVFNWLKSFFAPNMALGQIDIQNNTLHDVMRLFAKDLLNGNIPVSKSEMSRVMQSIGRREAKTRPVQKLEDIAFILSPDDAHLMPGTRTTDPEGKIDHVINNLKSSTEGNQKVLRNYTFGVEAVFPVGLSDKQLRDRVFSDVIEVKQERELQLMPTVKNAAKTIVERGLTGDDALEVMRDAFTQDGEQRYSDDTLTELIYMMGLDGEVHGVYSYSDLKDIDSLKGLYHEDFVGYNPLVIVHSLAGNQPVISLIDPTQWYLGFKGVGPESPNFGYGVIDKKDFIRKNGKYNNTFGDLRKGILGMQLLQMADANDLKVKNIAVLGMMRKSLDKNTVLDHRELLNHVKMLTSSEAFMSKIENPEMKRIFSNDALYDKNYFPTGIDQLLAHTEEDYRPGSVKLDDNLDGLKNYGLSRSDLERKIKARMNSIRSSYLAGIPEAVNEYETLSKTLFETNPNFYGQINDLRAMTGTDMKMNNFYNVDNDFMQLLRLQSVKAHNMVVSRGENYVSRMDKYLEPLLKFAKSKNPGSNIDLEYVKNSMIERLKEKGSDYFDRLFKTSVAIDKETGDKVPVRLPLIWNSKAEGVNSQGLDQVEIDFADAFLEEMKKVYVDYLHYEGLKTDPDYTREEAEKKFDDAYTHGMVPVVGKSVNELMMSFVMSDVKAAFAKWMDNIAQTEKLFLDITAPRDGEVGSGFLNMYRENVAMEQAGLAYGKPNELGDRELILLKGGKAKNDQMASNLENAGIYLNMALNRKMIYEDQVLPFYNATNAIFNSLERLSGKKELYAANKRYIDEYINRLVHQRNADYNAQTDGVMVGNTEVKLPQAIRKFLAATSFGTLAYSVKIPFKSAIFNQLNAIATALANDLSRFVFKGKGVKNLFGTKELMQAHVWQFKNPLYARRLAEKYHVINRTEKDLLDNPITNKTKRNILDEHYAHWGNWFTDTWARSLVMVAQMIKDGSLDAHTYDRNTGEIMYDETKDQRWYTNGKLRTEDGSHALRNGMEERLIDQGLQTEKGKLTRAYDHITADDLKWVSNKFVIGSMDNLDKTLMGNHYATAMFSQYRLFSFDKFANAGVGLSTRQLTAGAGFKAVKEIVTDELGNTQEVWISKKDVQEIEGFWQSFMGSLTTLAEARRNGDYKGWWDGMSDIRKYNLARAVVNVGVVMGLMTFLRSLGDDKKEKDQIQEKWNWMFSDLLVGFLAGEFFANPIPAINAASSITDFTLFHKGFNRVAHLIPGSDIWFGGPAVRRLVSPEAHEEWEKQQRAKKAAKEKDDKPTAKNGFMTGTGGNWRIVEDLAGLPSHDQGGVDLAINNGNVSFMNEGYEYYAKNGLYCKKRKKNG